MNDIIRQWPSLSDQLTVADNLYGDRGVSLLTAWLDEQAGYVGDPSFARLFSDHITLPGIAPIDYAHRLIRTPNGDLLGGIRFYILDVSRPFIDVLAHSFDDLDALAACVAAEWTPFAAPVMRLRNRPGRLRGPGTSADQTIHAARADKMARPDGRVELVDFDDAEEAIRLIEARYRHIEATGPELARDLPGPDPDDIRRWVAAGLLQAVRADGRTVGAFAAAHAGRGYAASAQALWAARAAADDPAALLIGTIARRNHASRRTAETAGRPALLEDVFVELPR
jgi:hypothetical protein